VTHERINWWLPSIISFSNISTLCMWSWSTNVTERQTDRRTDGQTTCDRYARQKPSKTQKTMEYEKSEDGTKSPQYEWYEKSKDGMKNPRYKTSKVRRVHQWHETSMVRIVYGTKSLVPTPSAYFKKKYTRRVGRAVGQPRFTVKIVTDWVSQIHHKKNTNSYKVWIGHFIYCHWQGNQISSSL